jgi:hypothetical protein
MITLAVLSGLGVVAALLRGGSLAAWSRVQVRWSAAAMAALALLLVLHNHPVDQQQWAIEFGPAIWTACLAALFAVVVRNCVASREQRAAWLIAALGVGLNLLVVAANGGYMPQSTGARLVAFGKPLQADAVQLRNVKPMDESAQLIFLGDVIAEPSWLPKANVISIGDVLLAVGLTCWAFGVTRRRVA